MISDNNNTNLIIIKITYNKNLIITILTWESWNRCHEDMTVNKDDACAYVTEYNIINYYCVQIKNVGTWKYFANSASSTVRDTRLPSDGWVNLTSMDSSLVRDTDWPSLIRHLYVTLTSIFLLLECIVANTFDLRLPKLTYRGYQEFTYHQGGYVYNHNYHYSQYCY